MPDDRLRRMNRTQQEFFDNRTSNRRLSFERKIVRKVLLRAGSSQLQLKVNKPTDGGYNEETYLTFAWLHDEYPSIPIRLMAHEIWRPHLVDFLKPRSRRNDFWPKWKEVEEVLGGERESGLSIGCVFPTPQATGLGDMIMHDLDMQFTDVGVNAEYVRMQRIMPSGRSISLESLELFATRLSNIWSA